MLTICNNINTNNIINKSKLIIEVTFDNWHVDLCKSYFDDVSINIKKDDKVLEISNFLVSKIINLSNKISLDSHNLPNLKKKYILIGDGKLDIKNNNVENNKKKLNSNVELPKFLGSLKTNNNNSLNPTMLIGVGKLDIENNNDIRDISGKFARNDNDNSEIVKEVNNENKNVKNVEDINKNIDEEEEYFSDEYQKEIEEENDKFNKIIIKIYGSLENYNNKIKQDIIKRNLKDENNEIEYLKSIKIKKICENNNNIEHTNNDNEITNPKKKKYDYEQNKKEDILKVVNNANDTYKFRQLWDTKKYQNLYKEKTGLTKLGLSRDKNSTYNQLKDQIKFLETNQIEKVIKNYTLKQAWIEYNKLGLTGLKKSGTKLQTIVDEINKKKLIKN
jgi:hypothetical protein